MSYLNINMNQHGMNVQSKHLKMNWGEDRLYTKGQRPAIVVSVSEAREWRQLTLAAIAERYGVSEVTAYNTFRSVWGSKSFMNWAMKVTGSPVIRRKSTV